MRQGRYQRIAKADPRQHDRLLRQTITLAVKYHPVTRGPKKEAENAFGLLVVPADYEYRG